MAAENATVTAAENIAQAASTTTGTIQQVWDKIAGYIALYGLSLLAAILILVIGKWAARLLSNILEKAMVRAKVNQTLAVFTKNLVYYALLIFIVIAALDKVGISATPFTAIIAAAGLAVGFALQGTLANFASGVMLILFQPFQVGDYVEAGGAAGTVSEIQIFSTIIMTADNKKIIVPNSKISGDKITIFLAKPK